MEPIFVYITCSTPEEAHLIGKTIVQDRLAACANVQAGMESIYWWDGKLETGQEAILVFKTLQNKLPELIERVKALHSYTVPCIVAMPISGGNPDYLEWIRREVSPAT